MKNQFNIQKLFKQAFGITGVMYDVAQSASKNSVDDKYSGITTIPLPTSPHSLSVLGTPIYEQITLSLPDTVIKGITKSKGFTYTFPDWPLFDITAQWLIQKTNVQGSMLNGSVKEFIQQDDFAITIRGFLINYATQDYPTQLVNDLWKVISCKQSLNITSAVFNLLDIHQIVITDAQFPALEGYMNVQPFQINALSDKPILLEIKSVKTNRPILPGQQDK